MYDTQCKTKSGLYHNVIGVDISEAYEQVILKVILESQKIKLETVIKDLQYLGLWATMASNSF